jgi:pantoate--beta-alanine ligase
MEIIRSKQTLQDAIRRLKAEGKTIGLVPTMGALHSGHISLVDIAARQADVVISSVFVNPTQFGPNEDFSKYPRSEKEDLEKLNNTKTTIAYLPAVEDMYGEGNVTQVTVPGISSELCGAFRPGHFDGVATVVTKLFMQATPDIAVFGEKDYQQLHIIRQLTRDLDIPVKILGGEVVRETDGLAMSSRNRYLSEEERKTAAGLYKFLNVYKAKLMAGQGVQVTTAKAQKILLENGFTSVDYVELRDAETLKPIDEIKKPARLLAAAYLGTTRLIDNVEIKP